MGRWNSLLERRTALRLELLDLDDRYRFLAWLIKLTNELDNVFIPKLASWLSKVGVTDADRIKSRWAEERVGLVEMSSDLNPTRLKEAGVRTPGGIEEGAERSGRESAEIAGLQFPLTGRIG